MIFNLKFTLLVIFEVAEKGIGEIAQTGFVEWNAVFVDDVGEDKLANIWAPIGQFLHVSAVSGQEPRKEINGIALINVPKDLIEKSDGFDESGVVVTESRTAHVVSENVSAHGQHCRFQIDSSTSTE